MVLCVFVVIIFVLVGGIRAVLVEDDEVVSVFSRVSGDYGLLLLSLFLCF